MLDPDGEWARSLRLDLAREHLGTTDVDDLAAPGAMFEAFRDSARRLDQWRRRPTGDRPPGQLRTYSTPELGRLTLGRGRRRSIGSCTTRTGAHQGNASNGATSARSSRRRRSLGLPDAGPSDEPAVEAGAGTTVRRATGDAFGAAVHRQRGGQRGAPARRARPRPAVGQLRWSRADESFWTTPISLDVGSHGLDLDLRHVVNDPPWRCSSWCWAPSRPRGDSGGCAKDARSSFRR